MTRASSEFAPPRLAQNRAVGVVAIFLVATLVALIADSTAVAAVVVLGGVLLDRVALAVPRSPEEGSLQLEMTVLPAVAGEGFFVGGRARVRIALRDTNGENFPIHLLHLLTPPGVEARGGGCVRIDWAGGEAVVAQEPGGRRKARAEPEFILDLARVGVVVLPGVLLRRSSPVGLFYRDRTFLSRTEVVILPEYRQTPHPALARFLARKLRGQEAQAGSVRGSGSDFAELRDYRYPDSMRRVDWKATARRTNLMVREYEDPREFSIHVILDGSIDMTAGPVGRVAFARACDFIGKVAFSALSQGMALDLTVYDREVTLRRTLRGGTRSLGKLLADLVSLPRQALLRSRAPGLAQAALDHYRKSLGRSGAASFEEFMRHYFGTEIAEPDAPAEYLADFHPARLTGGVERCDRCDGFVFVDEAGCPACMGADRESLSPRAACLAELLSQSLSGRHDRGIWIVASAFGGGEACETVARLLELASTGYRTVHVLAPAEESLIDRRVRFPGSVGSYAALSPLLADADRLFQAERYLQFRRGVRAAGVRLHTLTDPDRMEALVAELLLGALV